MVKPGLEVLFEEITQLIDGRRVALITNNTAVTSDLRDIVEVFHDYENLQLTRIWSVEHGLYNGIQNGGDQPFNHRTSGTPVRSIVSFDRLPSKAMLDDVDVVFYDILNAGVRWFGNIYNMVYAMQGCAEAGKPIVVLDRPNPINARVTSGKVLDPRFKSGIGLFPIPMRYGMTDGELGLLINKEFGIGARLTVVPMRGYQRDMWYDETGLPWIEPAPNLPTLESLTVYPATCLFEGTNVSEGRGTTHPFEFIGAPWIDGWDLARNLNKRGLPGVYFKETEFSPTFQKYAARLCSGIRIHVQDRDEFEPIATGLHILHAINELYKDDLTWRSSSAKPDLYTSDIILGTNEIRKGILDGKDPDALMEGWGEEVEQFKDISRKYWLYERESK